MTSVSAEVWGGGGGGAGTTANNDGGESGGGGGAYSKKLNITVVPGNSYTVTIGAAGTSAQSAGGTGGDSWFCNATTNCATIGGTAVQSGAKGGTGGSGRTTNGIGGASASGVGDTKYSGGNGGDGGAPTIGSGGGGGAGGSTANGGNGGNGSAGSGGTAGVGNDGGGNGGSGLSVEGNGSSGIAPGGGGSGAYLPDATNHSGGAGAIGRVILTYTTVSNVSSSLANGTYKAGQLVPITVTFSGAVTVTGTPTITLETGSIDRVVNYSSGSGGTTLIFNYTVQAGDTSSDLDYVSTSSLSLNGGTITNSVGGNAILTLPTVGGASSIAGQKAIVIDTSAPTNQDTVFVASTAKIGGTSVTVVSAGETGGAIWFAPSGTTSFVAGSTMTTAGGTATSILAPATAGAYRMFVIDAAGNVSAQSTAILTVDNTAPTTPGTPTASTPEYDDTPTWTWTASTDSGSGLTTPPYAVGWSLSSSFATGVSSSTATTNSFTHSVALAEGTWYFRVRASDVAGNFSNFSPNGSVLIKTTYTVTFNKNGGDTEANPTTKTASYGGNVGTLPTPPTKTGYTFNSWNTQADGNGTTFNASTAVTADITVYAKWTINTYTVTFNSNGGSAVSPITGVPYNTTITLPTAPTKTGYTFSGWYTDDGTFLNQFTASTPVTSDVTVYAKWVIINNPVPTLASISPNSKIVGDPEFTLTLIGTNFISSSVVRVNGNARTTFYASSTQLTATIPATDLVASTTLAITVFNGTPGGGESSSRSLYVNPFVIIPTKFVITSATTGTIDLPSTVTIQAQNALGEVADTYGQDVTLVTSGSATGAGLVNIINGVGSTTVSDTVVETVHLSLSDSQSTGLDYSSTRDVYFGPGVTAVLSASSTSIMEAGTLLSVTASRRDRLGNFVTSGSETYYLSSNSLSASKKFYDAAVGGNIVTTVTIPNNFSSATFWYYDDKVGTPTVTISDNSPADGLTGIDDATVSVTVNSASASALFMTDPGNLVAGNRLHYELSRQDQFGNLSTNGTLPVYLYHTSTASSTVFYDASTGGNIIASVTMNPGVATTSFWFYADKVGTMSVTASDKSGGADGPIGVNDASDSVTVSPSSVAILTLNNPGDMSAGGRVGYTVTRKDAYSNAVSTGAITVYLSHDSLGTSTSFYDASSGGNIITSIGIAGGSSANNFWFYSNDVGNYNVTVSDTTPANGATGIVDATDPITVNAIPIVATRFVIISPASATVGDTTTINVEAQDVSGNIDTSTTTSVTLHTNGSATPGGIVNIVNGVGTINIIDTKAETVTLTLSDSGSTGLDVSSTKTINFLAGPTAKYTITGASSALAGDRTIYSIGRYDQYDNLVTSGVSAVYLYDNAPVGTSYFYNAASGGTQITSTSILNGSSAVDVWFMSTKAGSWTVDSSDNISHADGATGIIDGTHAIVISPNVTARLTLNDPGDMFNGTRLGYTGTRYDAYNNLVTSGSVNYYLYSTANGTSTAFYNVGSGGVPITNINFANGSSTANFWYFETKNGTWTIYLSDNPSNYDGATGINDGEDAVTVSSVPIVPTKFIIVVSANSVAVGGNITATIRAVDDSDNIDTTYQNNVTLRASGSATGEGLIDIVNGVGETTIADAVEESVTLSLRDTEGTGLGISSTQVITFTSAPVIASGVSGGGTYIGPISPVVSFTGRAFPQANVEIVAIQGGQVPVGGSSTGGSGGNFNVSYNGQLPSSANTFALVVYDKDNRIAQTKIFKLGTNNLLFQTVLLSPTVSLNEDKITRGTFAGITGSAMPNYKIELSVDGVKAPETATADATGNYSLVFNTYRYNLGAHKLRVRQVDDSGKSSDYSIDKTFTLVKSFSPKADLNNDGKADIQDWSIFMIRYKGTDEALKQSIDMNNDGKVDTKDLSLFLEALKQ